jgi:uncharacterized membrane protein
VEIVVTVWAQLPDVRAYLLKQMEQAAGLKKKKQEKDAPPWHVVLPMACSGLGQVFAAELTGPNLARLRPQFPI